MGRTEIEDNNDRDTWLSYQEILELPSQEYITYVKRCIDVELASFDFRDPETGYVSGVSWKRLVDGGILAAALRDRDSENRLEEHSEIIRYASYKNTQFGLMYGIMTALVIDNLHKFGSERQKEEYFDRFRQGKLCGFAFTEKELSGSTIEMNSFIEKRDDGMFYIDFEKRWQGLSGNDLLVFVKNKNIENEMAIFIVQKEEYTTKHFDTLLNLIPYGINTGNGLYDKERLLVHFSGIKSIVLLQQIFADSRIGFASMALGQQERIEENAYIYAKNRRIGRKTQDTMEVPLDRLEPITPRRIITQAVYERVKSCLKSNPDTSKLITVANMVKLLATTYSYLSAQDAVDLIGGDGFLMSDAKAYMMTRIERDIIEAFMTFEGNNDWLNTEVGHIMARKPLYDSDKSGGIYDYALVAENLTKDSKDAIEFIQHSVKTKLQCKIFGEIVFRCLGLGCIDKNLLTPTEYTMAIGLLNFEIQQLVHEYSEKYTRNKEILDFQ